MTDQHDDAPQRTARPNPPAGFWIACLALLALVAALVPLTQGARTTPGTPGGTVPVAAPESALAASMIDAALVLAGGQPATPPPAEAYDGDLRQASSCPELTEALAALHLHAAGSNGVGVVHFTDGPAVMEATDDAATGDAASSAPRQGDATNTQVAGVDELDVVEVVSGHLLRATEQAVMVLQVDGGGEPAVVGQLALDEQTTGAARAWGGAQLLGVGDDQALVVLTGRAIERDAGASERGFVPDTNRTVVLLVDLADPTSPQLVERMIVDGMLVDARLSGGVLRLATRFSGPHLDPWAAGPVPAEQELQRLWEQAEREARGDDGRYVEPDRDELTRLERERSAQMRQRLEAAAAGLELHDVVPLVREGTGAGAPLLACDELGLPSVWSGNAIVSVSTVRVDGLDLVDSAAVLTSAEHVYDSGERVVISAPRGNPGPWPVLLDDVAAPAAAPPPDVAVDVAMPVEPGWWPWWGPSQTDLHVFDLQGDAIHHSASATVPGRLVNSFAMDVVAGAPDVLRVASTANVFDEDDDPRLAPMRTHSLVTTFALPDRGQGDGDGVDQLGQVDGLGPDEDIQSVRFVGDVAYVVTFRRTDPLYVVDLSDPAAPASLGELKIEGYSAYLHPLSEDLVLGIGQDADPRTGATRGVQVSTFDVSDPTAPRRIDVHVLPDSHTTAEHDHHAVTLLEDEQGLRLVIPYTGHGDLRQDVGDRWGGWESGALAYRIDADGQVRMLGRLLAGGQSDPAPDRATALGEHLLLTSHRSVSAWSLDDLAFTGAHHLGFDLKFEPGEPTFEPGG